MVPRLIIISDSPSSGTWVAQHRAFITPLYAKPHAASHGQAASHPGARGPFPYTFARPGLVPESLAGGRKVADPSSRVRAARASPSRLRASLGAVTLTHEDAVLAAELSAEADAAKKAEAARYMAVMASCRYQVTLVKSAEKKRVVSVGGLKNQ